jgi:hypothetical protein
MAETSILQTHQPCLQADIALAYFNDQIFSHAPTFSKSDAWWKALSDIDYDAALMQQIQLDQKLAPYYQAYQELLAGIPASIIFYSNRITGL